MVRESGFALAQGYLFSRPQSGPAIEQHVYRERPFASLLVPRPVWLELEVGGAPAGLRFGTPADAVAPAVRGYSGGSASAAGGST